MAGRTVVPSEEAGLGMEEVDAQGDRDEGQQEEPAKAGPGERSSRHGTLICQDGPDSQYQPV